MVDDVRPFEPRHQVLPGRRPRVAVEQDGAEHHTREGDRPGRLVLAREPCQRPAEAEPPVTRVERRDPGEQPEVDREALAVPRPVVAAERGHPEERHVAVHRDRERERARARRIGVRELENGEREERDRPRPASEPQGVLREWPRLAPAELAHPDEQVGQGTPGREAAPHVPEHDRQHGHAEPEDHVHPGRCEVAERVGVAEQRGEPHEEEQHDRDRLDDHAERAEDEGREPLAERLPVAPLPEQRLPPEGAEEHERDDEDDRRAPVEEPRRDREVLDSPDPVRDEPGTAQGFTSSTASSVSVGCNSSSKRPAMFAVNGRRSGFPGTISFSML